MYGTICRFQIKPGMESKLEMLNREYESVNIVGARAEYVYRMDNNPNEYYMAVVFDSEEAYKNNAASPDQDARYRKFRELLVADPEWHDGTLVFANTEMAIR
jgi:quinol monooxygenase YgiN